MSCDTNRPLVSALRHCELSRSSDCQGVCGRDSSRYPLCSGILNRSDLLGGRNMSMADSSMGQITLAYRGETQQFVTLSQAAHFLRQDRIKMGWFQEVVEMVSGAKEAIAALDDKDLDGRHLRVNLAKPREKRRSSW